jgi:hypothetical protein
MKLLCEHCKYFFVNCLGYDTCVKNGNEGSTDKENEACEDFKFKNEIEIIIEDLKKKIIEAKHRSSGISYLLSAIDHPRGFTIADVDDVLIENESGEWEKYKWNKSRYLYCQDYDFFTPHRLDLEVWNKRNKQINKE